MTVLLSLVIKEGDRVIILLSNDDRCDYITEILADYFV